jgi:hypothetical protein
LEEVGEEGAAFGLEDAADDFDAMVQEGVPGEVQEGAAGAGLGVVGAEDESGDPSQDEGTGAHGARLEGDIEGAVVQAPGSEGPSGEFQGDAFRMCGRIVRSFSEIEGLGDDLPMPNDERSNGDFAEGDGILGEGEGVAHPVQVGFGNWIGEEVVGIPNSGRAITYGRECGIGHEPRPGAYEAGGSLICAYTTIIVRQPEARHPLPALKRWKADAEPVSGCLAM